MDASLDLYQLFADKAKASPGFSFKTIGDVFRITFNIGAAKKSYLVSAQRVRMFSVDFCDWKYFYELTNMEGESVFVPEHSLTSWLQHQIMGIAAPDLVMA